MSAETTVLLAPGREELREQLLKIGCKVREESRGYMPILIAVRAFSLSGLWVDPDRMELTGEEVDELRGECVINGVKMVVAENNGNNDDVVKLALFLAGMESEHAVTWRT